MADQLNVPFGTFIGKTKEGGEKKSRGISHRVSFILNSQSLQIYAGLRAFFFSTVRRPARLWETPYFMNMASDQTLIMKLYNLKGSSRNSNLDSCCLMSFLPFMVLDDFRHNGLGIVMLLGMWVLERQDDN